MYILLACNSVVWCSGSEDEVPDNTERPDSPSHAGPSRPSFQLSAAPQVCVLLQHAVPHALTWVSDVASTVGINITIG